MSKVKAEWAVELNVNCPECKHLFDLTEVDDFWAGAEAGEHETPRTTDFECCCPECDHEFTCDFTYLGASPMSSRIRNFGWNRLKLATLTYEQINTLEEQVKQEHACKDGIHMYDKAGRDKLDALSWAAHNKQRLEAAK